LAFRLSGSFALITLFVAQQNLIERLVVR